MNKNIALEFLVQCIGECDADGYQQSEKSEVMVPDNWEYDGSVLRLRFGDDEYVVTIKRRHPAAWRA